MHGPFTILRELVVVAAVGVLAAVALARLRLPTVTVLLLAGALVGPHALGLVGDMAAIEVLAEVGVVLLLFTIGLEFSLARLSRIWRLVVVGGALQVGLTTAAVTALVVAAGGRPARGVFFGFLVALSSTAIVLRALGERGEMDAPHGRFVVGALIFQDLCVVPMTLLVPVLAGRAGGGDPAAAAAVALGKAALVVGLTLVFARKLVPRLFARVDRARSREVFVLSVLVVCLGTAWLTSLAGLSLALGAFLAGVVLADSDYAHRALGDVLPLRDALTSLFFMSVGMLVDPRVLLAQPLAVAGLFLALLVGKALVATLACMAMRFPPRVAVLAGVGLAQFGEFGFVLARAGGALGLLRDGEARVLLAAAVLTMVVTPVAIRFGPRLAAGASRLTRLERLLVGAAAAATEARPEVAAAASRADEAAGGRVVVVGYGVAGRALARALRDAGLPYLVLEMNAETVRRARAAGEPVAYGDVASAETLAHARVAEARTLALLINDPAAAERAIVAARAHAPDTPIVVRTRYERDAPRLVALGASEVVTEEVEAGLEVLARVLRRLGVPRNAIGEHVARAREAAPGRSARDATVPRRALGEIRELAELLVESFVVREGAHAAGRSALALALRARSGALVVALQRDGALADAPDPGEGFRAGDVLYLVGSRAALDRATALLERGEGAEGAITE